MSLPTQTSFLTFNDAIGGGRFQIKDAPEKETEEDLSALREPMELKTPWVFWEQFAGYRMTKVVTFKTAQEFFSVWNGVPQPSELLDNKKLVRESSSSGQGDTVEALSIFREGIAVEWEDKANEKGGKFQIILKPPTMTNAAEQIDEYWNNIVLAMIGETMDASHQITGVRLVDKLSAKAKVTDSVRIELWYHSASTKTELDQLRKSLEKTLVSRLDGTQGPAWKGDAIQAKPHKAG
mmetsp:Transcript_7468/g.16833  ORF Transcript_7468/g.16833 Transcript_7468/m.16833 type:complete len:237 (-) Transcript_7468:71-781(-)|eukprot:CAMPEP_0206481828 /NCGR_PEP_ID=MMETSP0324_2-20121206/38420_1 /ASSEMBLY_ACC=CAM_ASM_000836 /TAXON_ID=2866 /ORGANISM="Crypthecodinium cohnii, Strain Seligo" /LENGTH=236 /DNA_ID=CAMNT_0053959477 /DNA_START=326 /DNA_END=1036 /DNA_ORIENTATION=+